LGHIEHVGGLDVDDLVAILTAKHWGHDLDALLAFVDVAA
jgi:hypothetical protein